MADSNLSQEAVNLISSHGPVGGIITLALAIIKWWLGDIKKTISSQGEKQSACRESLPTRFADKELTHQEFTRVWAAQDKTAYSVAKIEGKLGLKSEN